MNRPDSGLPENCLNCDTPLQGQWCHHCGQKAKSQVRHFGSVFADIMDTVFEYDNRIWRTLLPLYLRPGKITRDYVAGKRARYVLPFRLFFVLSVVSFLALQFIGLPSGLLPQNGMDFNATASQAIFAQIDNEAAVIAERDRLIQELENAMTEMATLPNRTASEFAISGAQAGIAEVQKAAERRLAELNRPDPMDQMPEVADEPPAAAVQDTTDSAITSQTTDRPSLSQRGISVDGNTLWNPQTDPLVISWLPAAANSQLNLWLQRGVDNIERVSENPRELMNAMLNLFPLVLFFMLPLFALLLKFFYLFSGRLYMEHFVVALHSHSFLFLALLVSLLLSYVQAWTAGLAVWGGIASNVWWFSLLWIPGYLLLMQKQVYGQGWLLTLIKYWMVGMLYCVMLLFALIAAAVLSLISL